ncbi:hypothetical protein ANN_25331 [Periplaneta americana]|uniref:Per a allergen n=1 Tax=Periplaneta americana TaxID=6978 RepID=A0ABQ8S1D6_PERAM|nr:hypothetical protein ANN_25331 [Periplaneta americana]
MAGLCEGGNEPPGSLKAKLRRADRIPGRVQEFQPRCGNAYNGSPEIFPAKYFSIDSQLKMAAPFKRFGEVNISEIEFQ